MTDFDSPWKEALDLYFQAFLALFFPLIHDDIAWERSFELLDKELQKITPRGDQGRLYVDKLVKVWRRNGQTVWVLIHIEVQTQRESDFTRRLFTYNNRLTDHYNRTVVTFPVLADDDPNWRPTDYRNELWGWSVGMTFPPAKLLDYADRVPELEAESNPFAKVVLAHLKALETRRDPEERRVWKFRLFRGLHEQGLGVEEVRQLFRLIDWLLELPPVLERQFWADVHTFEEERKMPFIDFPTRMGIRQGMLLLIEDALRFKFGEEGVKLMTEIEPLEDMCYRPMHEAILKASTLVEVRQAIVEVAAPPPPPPPKKSRSKRSKS